MIKVISIKLVNVGDDFSVESLKLGNETVEFVHNKETGKSYFNQGTMCSMLDLSKDTVSNHCRNYEKQLENLSENIGLNLIRLKTSNRGRKTKFYSFDGLTYVVYRSNSDKAMEVRNIISSILDTMFNVATGKTSINSNKDWLKQQCEVKYVQASTCKESSKNLYGCGLKHEADKIYSKYKKLDAEALKYKEMYLDYERLDKEVASVRNDSTEQLKLI